MHQAQSLATLRLDRSSRIPLFRQLYEAVKQAILTGRIGPGIQLPPTRELSRLFGISRQTVLNAYAQLMAEGYLSGAIGKGTFVSISLPLQRNTNQPESNAETHELLRPLSPRGQLFVNPKASLNMHPEGAPKAFRLGMPGLDVFPFDVWARLEARRWRHPLSSLGYGYPAGFLPLREALAVYLRASRGVQCEAEQILITSGSQQALYMIATMLLAPGESAWIEEPGYRGANAALHAAEARVCPVPIDSEGLSVRYGGRHYPDAKMVYVTPSHQFPLGVTMSLPRRLELLAWAKKNKAWVIEDDYDSEYRYTGPPLASLQSLDKEACVLYVGTLSKILFPGLRLGYMVLPAALVDAFARAKAVVDRHAPVVPQMVLTDFINGGHFGRHIKRTREVYAERRNALLQAIDAQIANHLEPGPADAGLQISARFRQPQNDHAVMHAALQRGVEVRALSQFYHSQCIDSAGSSKLSGLTLGFASVPIEEIKQGVSVLRDVLNQRR
jgi:GntR family transcriptional regulator/MocR family aminotransferase